MTLTTSCQIDGGDFFNFLENMNFTPLQSMTHFVQPSNSDAVCVSKSILPYLYDNAVFQFFSYVKGTFNTDNRYESDDENQEE